MKKFLTSFFATLGVVFFCLIMIAWYLYLTDPWNLKPLFQGGEKIEFVVESVQAELSEVEEVISLEETADAHPAMNDQQEQALKTLGVDPASIPAEISPEQQACFIDVLGQDRVGAIVAGDPPTAIEVFSSLGCLN